MKKMNKMYEAPKAEMIEMQMPVVMMASSTPESLTGGADEGGDEPGMGND